MVALAAVTGAEPDRFLSEKEAAQFLGLSPRTLQAGRSGRGAVRTLPWCELSARCIRYRRGDLVEFMNARVQVGSGGTL